MSRREARTARRRPLEAARRRGTPFIVLTGLSGSGKSQAIRALEDLGYFCVDNLPTTLIPTLAKLSLRAAATSRRSRSSSTSARATSCRRFRRSSAGCGRCARLNPVLIFLEASDAALVRRFSETRRPHPLAPDRSASEGIRDERDAAERHPRAWPTRSSTRRT